ncbi:MAG: hypothetical protein IRZ03_06660 [Acidobacterium ailaaui]|nr:hypothetical protein [Pseudacidobacterium ailaaui]MCL6463155.1 hypothetical protein [Pseudacidobacterium ailaaui]
MHTVSSYIPGSSEIDLRKPYARPEIVEYGSVAQVTKASWPFGVHGFPEPEQSSLSVAVTLV